MYQLLVMRFWKIGIVDSFHILKISNLHGGLSLLFFPQGRLHTSGKW